MIYYLRILCKETVFRMVEEFKRALNNVINENYFGQYLPNVTMHDIQRYKEPGEGMVIITDFKQPQTITYSVICIDKLARIIHYCGTDGSIMNNEAFRMLSELNDKGHYFRIIQYRYKCKYFHEGFAIYLVDLFTNQMKHFETFFTHIVPTDEEIIEMYELHDLYRHTTRSRRH